MSDLLTSYKKVKIEWELKIRTGLPSHYENKKAAQNHEHVFCVEIPYGLINTWGKLLNESENKEEVNLIDLFNLSVKGGWYALKRDNVRIQELIRKNICRIQAMLTKAKGRKKYELAKKVYVISVRKEEVVSIDDLMADVEMTQQEINEWRQKYSDLEQEKKRMYDEMKKEINKKEEEKYIETLGKKDNLRCQGKKINDVSRKQQGRKLKQLKNKAQCALWFSKTFGLEVEKISFKDDEKNIYNIDYNNDSQTGYNNLSEDDKSKLEQILFLLDKFCVGDEVYHELSLSSNGNLPKSYLIKQLRSNLNKTYHIERTPGRYTGAKLDFTSTLSSHIKDLLISKPELKDQTIDVKLSGDGARMSRTTNFMMFSFTLLQNDENVMSSKSNRTVAIVNGAEEYLTLKTSLSTIFNEINDLIEKGSLSIDGSDVKLNFFLGGDLKFLLMIMGMNAACSHYACLWCKVHKDDRWDTSKSYEHYYSSEMKRTLQDLQELCKLKDGNYGCINEPLLKIELTNVVPDELHLLLRITDVLLKNVIDETIERDAVEDLLKTKGQKKGIYLEKLIKSINDLGITFSIWNKKNADGSESSIKEFTSLLGSQKKKLLNEFPSKFHFFLNPDTTVAKIWNDFNEIYSLISNFNLGKDTHTELFSKGRTWINSFCCLRGIRPGYTRERVTPYMHVMAYHIPKFVQLHGCLKKFTGQGVEKNNADAKTILFCKSNKWDAASDILCTESRQWDLRHQERHRAKYVKRRLEYWGNEISVKRKERRVTVEHEEEEEEMDEAIDYKQYTISQLRQMIIEKNNSKKTVKAKKT